MKSIADADAPENWNFLIAWHDQLVRHDTLEAAYLDIVRHSRTFPHIRSILARGGGAASGR
jgi:hypothetical protein